MQYPVPKFQDVEDKIIGPLTFKQFIYLLGGVGASYAALSTLPKGLNIMVVILVGSLSLALAFYKINSQPFINILEAAFYYSIRTKLYLWKKTHQKPNKKKIKYPSQQNPVEMPDITKSNIKDIAWNLDINENIKRARTAQNIAKENILNSI